MNQRTSAFGIRIRILMAGRICGIQTTIMMAHSMWTMTSVPILVQIQIPIMTACQIRFSQIVLLIWLRILMTMETDGLTYWRTHVPPIHSFLLQCLRIWIMMELAITSIQMTMEMAGQIQMSLNVNPTVSTASTPSPMIRIISLQAVTWWIFSMAAQMMTNWLSLGVRLTITARVFGHSILPPKPHLSIFQVIQTTNKTTLMLYTLTELQQLQLTGLSTNVQQLNRIVSHYNYLT